MREIGVLYVYTIMCLKAIIMIRQPNNEPLSLISYISLIINQPTVINIHVHGSAFTSRTLSTLKISGKSSEKRIMHRQAQSMVKEDQDVNS